MRLDDAKETTIHPHEYIAKQPVNMAIYTRRTLTVPCSTMIKLTPNSKIEEQVVQRVHDGAKVYRTHTSDLFWQDAETAESGLRALAHEIEQSKKPGNKNPPSASQHLTTKDKGQSQANKAQGEPKETSTLGEAACSICAQLSPKPNPTRTLECRPQGNRPKGYCWVNNKGWLKYAEGDDPNSLLGTAIEHDFGPPHGKCRGRIVSIIKSETEVETTLYHAKYQDGDCEDLEEQEVNDRRMPKRDDRKLEKSHKLGHKQLKNDQRPVSAGAHSPAPGPMLTSVTDHTRKTAEELGGAHPQPRIVRGRETENNTVIYGWVLQKQGCVYMIHFPAAPKLDQHMTPQMVEQLRTGGEPVDLASPYNNDTKRHGQCATLEPLSKRPRGSTSNGYPHRHTLQSNGSRSAREHTSQSLKQRLLAY
jgi:hypothetical protein